MTSYAKSFESCKSFVFKHFYSLNSAFYRRCAIFITLHNHKDDQSRPLTQKALISAAWPKIADWVATVCAVFYFGLVARSC